MTQDDLPTESGSRPESTMDRGFIVGAVIGFMILMSMGSIATCIRGETEESESRGGPEPSRTATPEERAPSVTP